jgi:hypothetical protein
MLHLSSSSASAIDMTILSSETIDVDIFTYQFYSIFIKSDVNRVTQHCINVNDTLLVRGATVDLIESNSHLNRICIRLNCRFELFLLTHNNAIDAWHCIDLTPQHCALLTISQK